MFVRTAVGAGTNEADKKGRSWASAMHIDYIPGMYIPGIYIYVYFYKVKNNVSCDIEDFVETYTTLGGNIRTVWY